MPSEITDATIPPEGESFWYLVRGRDQCSVSTWGEGFDGAAPVTRLVDACP